jgi:hypothetical protein
MTIDRRVILAFAMLAPALVGCGSVDSDPDEKTSKHADPLLERQSACSGTPTDLRGRLTGAQRIVVGTIERTESLWQTNRFGDELIVTRALADVEETLRGDAQQAIEIEVEGGTIGELTLKVSDVPALSPALRAVFVVDPKAAAAEAWADKSPIYALHQRGLGMLELGADDWVKGSSVSLDDIRTLAREGAN